MDDVVNRFSKQGSAGRWDEMYSSETVRLEDRSFRERRDFTVAQVLARRTPDLRVLDLGCGTGPVVAELRRHGIDCVGIDYSPDMLEFARERMRALSLDDSNLFSGDCRSTPFEPGSFDVVVCLGVISYVENYEAVFQEIARLLKPGGTVVVSFRNQFAPVAFDPLTLIKNTVKRLTGRYRPPAYEIGRFMDHREFRSRIAACHFEYVAFRGIGFGPLRWGGRPIVSERVAIAISRALNAVFSVLHLRPAFLWLADVSLWVYRKPT